MLLPLARCEAPRRAAARARCTPRCVAASRARRAPCRAAAAASSGDAPAGGGSGFKLPGTTPSSQSSARAVCAVCAGTGLKPCGQCGGSGVNQEDLYGGRFKAGDVCWLCEGGKATMCGACADMTDTF